MGGSPVAGDFLKIFQLPLIQGNAATVLANPYSIVLTESTAKALFGKEDPMNKVIRFEHPLKNFIWNDRSHLRTFVERTFQ